MKTVGSVVQCGMAADASADTLSPLPVSLFERPFIESSATEVAQAQVCSVKRAPPQIRSAKGGSFQVGESQIAPPQISTIEECLCKVCSWQLGPLKIGVPQVGVHQIHIRKAAVRAIPL